MTLDYLLTRLHNVKQSGKGFTARCPAHDDKENSIKQPTQQKEGADGRR
jgi:hypothetical protein